MFMQANAHLGYVSTVSVDSNKHVLLFLVVSESGERLEITDRPSNLCLRKSNNAFCIMSVTS